MEITGTVWSSKLVFSGKTVLVEISGLDTALAGATVTAGAVGRSATVFTQETVLAGASGLDTALAGATVTGQAVTAEAVMVKVVT